MIQLEQYRDKFLAENLNDYIGFYPREFFVFDNFSSFQIIYKGRKYATVEHAYQSLKFIDTVPKIYRKIKNCKSAHDAQKIAYENRDGQAKDWDKNKVYIMENLLCAKLKQNPAKIKICRNMCGIYV